ncbi:MAG: tRNA (adenosine(37)-N6)-threonylcarbamoyltransferase complex ATPase subunit type 1 TsaE [Deltaproteobacteria bacterium]|nr:MAG: tRNA (adenosine(37)-N6)-threonylcarbamoyltransferase complex ATPase subunit type 1 TsaE [Deltaproteobacteria bacterium]
MTTRSPAETADVAEHLGRVAAPGTVVGLVGDLGAGKTLFVQGLARGLGVPADVRVVSPTFTLINEYGGGRLPLYHADLYRLERRDEVDDIGLDEVVRGDGVVAIEWADRFDVLGADALIVRLRTTGATERVIEVDATGPAARAVADAWADALAAAWIERA